MPPKFYKAKRQLDGIINEWVSEMKSEYGKRYKDTKKEISINEKFVAEIKRNLRKYLSIDPPAKINIHQN